MKTPSNELDFKLYVVTVDTKEGRFEYEYSTLKHARERLEQEEQGFIAGYKDGIYYSIDQKLKKDNYNYKGKTLELQQDAGEKLTVSIKAEDLYRELLTFFNWRKDRDNVDKVIKRFKKLGTTDHDRMIEQLKTIGY